MFTFKSKFANYKNCIFHITETGKNTRYKIWCKEDPLCTINLPGYDPSATTVAIKDYAENEGVLAFLQKNKLIKEIHGYIPSGFIRLPIVTLDINKLKAM